ncbi:glyoxalase domain protein [Natronomonas pharaonis DSM 2160]|uniref:Glyoxalase domain protein n=1 Tax=Natronomonas pharaonis (strain ATCC 35678 / DSM 2160 / CIP 103997 / JCM 8858 / NBRC 14720 / NCIMB 2260 / Gabara) TaxID=348780 RepID=A0A1U7EYA2_NATPD|nr:VOC family protein [Natronomonas pharaonis]CAI50193.1 glyoxalase domain protein [Natronomonas pharaonis DSM 2160]
MLGDCRWLTLEVTSLDSVAPFYRERLSLPLIEATDRQYRFDAGGSSELRLRRPTAVPRGGLHTHYAFSCPADAYDAWWDRLDADFDLQEVDFGSMRSLYLYDPAGNCVEIAGADEPSGTAGRTLSGIFEVVFEVADLPASEQFYTALGFEVVDRGENRTRTRLTNGPLDIELWEPQLGLADARGGVHVDVGINAESPAAVADNVAERVTKREQLDDGAVRIRDPDGHYLTFVRSER